MHIYLLLPKSEKALSIKIYEGCKTIGHKSSHLFASIRLDW